MSGYIAFLGTCLWVLQLHRHEGRVVRSKLSRTLHPPHHISSTFNKVDPWHVSVFYTKILQHSHSLITDTIQTISAFFHLKNIAYLRLTFTFSAAETLIHAFVTFRLDYCNSLLCGSLSKVLSKLQYIHKPEACLLTHQFPRPCHSHPPEPTLAPHHTPHTVQKPSTHIQSSQQPDSALCLWPASAPPLYPQPPFIWRTSPFTSHTDSGTQIPYPSVQTSQHSNHKSKWKFLY